MTGLSQTKVGKVELTSEASILLSRMIRILQRKRCTSRVGAFAAASFRDWLRAPDL